jgi:iron complex transport system substrate-binding protein
MVPGWACRPAADAPSSPEHAEMTGPKSDLPQVHDFVAEPVVVAEEADAGPARIITTAPQLTEIACALGLRDRLVGRSSYCDHPPGIEAVPDVGSLLDLNLEQIMSLEPDLVLISGKSRLIRERFDDAGIRYESLPDASLADVFSAIKKLGDLTGRPRTAANLVIAIRADLTRLVTVHRPAQPLRVLMLIGRLSDPPRSPSVAGPGSYLVELLAMAGHTNAAANLGRPYGQLPLEEILVLDPDVILEFVAEEPTGPDQLRRSYELWSQIGPLTAVTNHRLYQIPGQVHMIPGPRVAQTLREIIARTSN